MNVRGRLFALSLAAALCGMGTALAGDSLQTAGDAARADLEKSLKELTALRASIAAEKVPLGRELTALEEKLASLRRQQDGISRGVDTANLDLTNLKSEQKLRQEEVTYLGSLLEEYRANFESKIDVSERQRYEPVILAAKDAPANGNLSVQEKFGLQVALVKTSVARLEEAIGGVTFAGSAIDPDGALIEGRFALVGPVAVFAADAGGTAGVSMPQTGSAQPAVRSLEKGLNAGIASLVASGTGLLPFDPTRGGALKELVQKWSLIDLFVKGGPIMWPLLLASVLALGTVIERIGFLITERKRRDLEAEQQMLDAVEVGDLDAARRIGSASKDFICRTLTYALEHSEKSVSNALMLAQSVELKRFKRGIPILDTVITLAPLLGLLGTVTGMMGSFSLIGGELSSPSAITGGISEALIATAFGLTIAILALIPFNYLNAKVQEARHELDAAAGRLELLLHPPREAVARPAPGVARAMA